MHAYRDTFSKRLWPHSEFVRSGRRRAVRSTWYHTCVLFLMPLTAEKIRHLPFSKEVSHETWSWRPFFRRSRFTKAPCSFFELCPFSVGCKAILQLAQQLLQRRCEEDLAHKLQRSPQGELAELTWYLFFRNHLE